MDRLSTGSSVRTSNLTGGFNPTKASIFDQIQGLANPSSGQVPVCVDPWIPLNLGKGRSPPGLLRTSRLMIYLGRAEKWM